MKATERIYERYPLVKEKMEQSNTASVILNTSESVFYNMALFFNRPMDYTFTLNQLHDHLQDEELLFALDLMASYFQRETYLIKEAGQSFYTESLLREPLLTGTGFARLVKEAMPDSKMRPSTIHAYFHRRSKQIPPADVLIEGTPYWREKTVKLYIERKRKDSRE